jgi:pantoate--beta-alanine ligase
MFTNKIRIFNNIDAWISFRQTKMNNTTLGLVPTMGALHNGHLKLIEKSISENNKTIVSIFVNPTQFNDSNDLKRYPKNFDDDLNKLSKIGVDYVLHPQYEELYNDDYRYNVFENKFSKELCGKSRDGHFNGVLTVVLKLLNIANADNAYFGEKDYQQYLLIKEMVEAFFIKTKIIPCPTIREIDGLAMSSRNLLLTKKERKIAPIFKKLLDSKMSTEQIKDLLKIEGFDVDYIEKRNDRIFGAVKLGNVRLIDNVKI